jgi:FMN phosphatase YigB (HAD superfamily)/DNA-binding XRE family transcriptional regulator
MNEVDLGKLLQRARQKAGLTQQQLCHQAGLSYSTLAKIERGAIKAQIAGVLGVSLDQLIGAPKTAVTTKPKKQSKSGVRFVYFDVNGCLVRFFHRAFTRIAEVADMPSDVVETAFWHHNDDVCRGKMSIEEFNRQLGAKFELTNFDWRDYYLEAVEPIREMNELLEWASEHYRVGLLTNIMPTQIQTMISKGMIPDVSYDAIIDSSSVGAIKPEAKIFEIAQKEAGVSTGEILLVDDARPNIMAAEKQGWHVLWFDDYEPKASISRIRKALEF